MDGLQHVLYFFSHNFSVFFGFFSPVFFFNLFSLFPMRFFVLTCVLLHAIVFPALILPCLSLTHSFSISLTAPLVRFPFFIFYNLWVRRLRAVEHIHIYLVSAYSPRNEEQRRGREVERGREFRGGRECGNAGREGGEQGRPRVMIYRRIINEKNRRFIVKYWNSESGTVVDSVWYIITFFFYFFLIYHLSSLSFRPPKTKHTTFFIFFLFFFHRVFFLFSSQ